MSTIEDIEHDTSVLAELTQKDLLFQICCRLDRHFPKDAAQLEAGRVFAELVKHTEGHIADIKKMGIPSLDQALRTSLEKYKAEVAASGNVILSE